MACNERTMTTFAIYARRSSPLEVLAQIKARGFDCETLKKRVFVRDASPIPVKEGAVQPVVIVIKKVMVTVA